MHVQLILALLSDFVPINWNLPTVPSTGAPPDQTLAYTSATMKTLLPAVVIAAKFVYVRS